MRKVQVTINVIMVADEAADGDYEHLEEMLLGKAGGATRNRWQTIQNN